MANYTDVLLINENVIKSVTNISENVSAGYLLPSIKLAQDVFLEETIGSVLKQSLQKKVFDNTLDTKYKFLLDEYIQPYLTYAVIVELIPNVAWKISNAGVLVTNDEKMTNVSTNDVDKIRNHYKHLSDIYKGRLQKYLIANFNDFPELSKSSGIDKIRHNLYSTASCNLNLGGERGRWKR